MAAPIQQVGGFNINRPKRRRRMVVAINAPQKCGKTHNALTAPSPIAFANTDTGLEGVIEKFQADGKVVYSKDYRLVLPTGTDINKNSEAGSKLWDEYKSDIRHALKSNDIRTIVADTESDTWELIRIARFGKLTQVMPHHYGPVNAEYANFWNEVYDTDKNLILLRKMKEEYDDATKKYTGKFHPTGYKEIKYLVQVNIELGRNDQGFFMRVIDCRQNMDIAGAELPGDMCNFQSLAQMVFPESQPSEWE